MNLDLFLTIGGFVATLCAGAWALVKVVVGQFEKRLDERFSAVEHLRDEGRKQWADRFGRLEENHQRVERDILALRAELAKEYVRREDFVRTQTVIEAKLDALAVRIENVVLRTTHHD